MKRILWWLSEEAAPRRRALVERRAAEESRRGFIEAANRVSVLWKRVMDGYTLASSTSKTRATFAASLLFREPEPGCGRILKLGMPRFRIPALLLACASVLSAKSYVAERYDVRVEVLPNASLRVTETTRLQFQGSAFSYVSRVIPKDGSDGIFNIVPAIDGQPARAEVQDTRTSVKIVWHFDAPPDSTREFTLTYTVAGAIRKDPDRDLLLWRAIPNEHEYPILASELTIEYPKDSKLAGRPEIRQAVAARHEQGRSVFTLPELAPDRGVRLRAEFLPGFVVQPPRWQAAEGERRERSVRAWTIAGTVTLLITVVGAFWLLTARRSTPEKLGAPPANAAHAVDVPPAIAARLAGSNPSIHQLVGTLFDLARRGAVSLVEGEPGLLGAKRYELQPQALGHAAALFESALLARAFPNGAASPARDFSSFVSELSTSSGEIDRDIERQMIASGLLDPDRLAIRRRWNIGGLVAMICGLIATALGGGLAAGAAQSGPDAAVPVLAAFAGLGAAVFLVAIGALIAAAKLSPLTSNGMLQAAPCRQLAQRLRSAPPASDASAEEFDRWLPYAFAFGLGAAWVKRFRTRSGAPLPPWFAVDESGVDSFAFLDVAASSASSVEASVSCDAGGGGAGGGSSSAG